MNLTTRAFQTRAEVNEGRKLTAIGVPFGQRIQIAPDLWEEFAPGSIIDDTAILRYGHKDPIGKITGTRDVDTGREVTARISQTSLGNDVVQLLNDEVLTKMSIGFRFTDPETEYTETNLDDGATLITYQKVRAVEYSVVEFPAYSQADVIDVRTKLERTHTMPKSTTDIDQMRSEIEDLKRTVELGQIESPEAPTVDTRDIGQILKAIANGDQTTSEAVKPFMNRAYDGGTTADDGTLTPVWVKDLTRIIEAANPIAKLFARGTLPAEGMQLEYTQLATNTIKVEKQENQGDALAKGKITTTRTEGATIETYGGANTMSFQEIQRSRANMVALTMRAMAVEAARSSAAAFHKFYEEQVTGQEANAIEITKAAADIAWADMLAMVLDASKAYQDLALSLDGVIVDRSTFLALGSLEGADGRPLMHVSGQGVNTVGSVDARNLKGELSGLTFIPDFDSTLNSKGIAGSFYHQDSLRQYTSGLAHLQDDSILNLSRDVAVYYYAANAAEIPGGLIPLKFNA